MKVLHIIPAAFDYFDDIKLSAFSLLENQTNLGISAEAFTLQYNRAVSRANKEEVAAVSPSTKYQGVVNISEAVLSFTDFDILHLHCPFLGAGEKILKWKKEHPDQPLVVTFYRRVRILDLFSFWIWWYNRYYLPRIFDVCEAVAVTSAESFKQNSGARYLKDKSKFIEIDNTSFFLGEDLTKVDNQVKLSPTEKEAWKYLWLYDKLLKEKINN